MSEEPAPPPLRLKPRAQAAPVAPADPIAPVAPAPAVLAATSETPRLRVKPRLTVSTGSTPPIVVPATAPVVGAAEMPSGDAAKFKLKPKVPDGVVLFDTSPAPTAGSAAPLSTVPGSSTPPLFQTSAHDPAQLESGILAPDDDKSTLRGISLSTMADLQVSTAPFQPTRPVDPAQRVSKSTPPFPVVSPSSAHVGAAQEIFGSPPPEEAKPEHHPGFKLGVSIAIALLAVAVGVGIFFGWKHFNPTGETVATVPPTAVKSQPDTAAVVAPTAAPAEPATPIPDSLAKLREAAAAQRAQEQARIDALATGSDPFVRTPPPATVPVGRIPTAPPTVIATPEEPVALAPGVTALGPGMVISDASPAFRTFVANVKISGVFQGDPPRALINDRTIRAGEFVNASLGISFDSVDAEKKQIVFKDSSGATVTRKY